MKTPDVLFEIHFFSEAAHVENTFSTYKKRLERPQKKAILISVIRGKTPYNLFR